MAGAATDRQVRVLKVIPALFLFLTSLATSQVTLSRFLGDHMVIQRDQPIALWGEAPPRARLVIRMGETQVSTEADPAGSWSAELPPQPATGKPFSITIQSGVQTLELQDLLMGDVWICAGQSNMDFPLSRDQDRDKALSETPGDNLRLFHTRYAGSSAGRNWDAATLAQLQPESFLQGEWTRCTPEAMARFSAVGYYFGHALHGELGVPIGLMDLAAGGTPTEAWISRSALAGNPKTRSLVEEGNWLKNPELEVWCQTRAGQNLGQSQAKEFEIPGDARGPNHPFKPGFMALTALKPLARTSVCGVLWYQGESNAESSARVTQHADLFPLLIQDMRDNFRQPDMPFLFVQLPAMGRPHWPLFREQQRIFSQQLPHVAMAVTIDVGHPTDVHPRQKRPVGLRLARLALHLTKPEGTAPTGPTIERFAKTKEGLRLWFANTAQQLATRDQAPPRGFEIIESDGTVHAVQARMEGATVLLLFPSTLNPVEVRYAWAPVPDCNLTDAKGLPASPFWAR